MLSFHYLCAIRNSWQDMLPLRHLVVICFHFIIFVLLGTAVWYTIRYSFCCDLLSFHYLCAIRNSISLSVNILLVVVICFHFIIFVLLGTAPIAGKLFLSRCDLLSFHYLCAIRNSNPDNEEYYWIVVICFHFIIFVLLGTAEKLPTFTRLALWFAFISLSLCY